jgi:hypothetical protein
MLKHLKAGGVRPPGPAAPPVVSKVQSGLRYKSGRSFQPAVLPDATVAVRAIANWRTTSTPDVPHLPLRPITGQRVAPARWWTPPCGRCCPSRNTRSESRSELGSAGPGDAAVEGEGGDPQ